MKFVIPVYDFPIREGAMTFSTVYGPFMYMEDADAFMKEHTRDLKGGKFIVIDGTLIQVQPV